MSRLLLIFDEPGPLIAAAQHLREIGVRDMDAHVPYRIAELDEVLDLPASPVRLIMLLAAVLVGGATWGLQWWTSVHGYPINSGGRPDNAWPVFTFAVFEMAVLAAAFAGLVTMFLSCGLPRLNHPFFADAQTERASDDRFYLSLPGDSGASDRLHLSAINGVREILDDAS